MLKTLLKQIKQYKKPSVLAAVFTVLEVILELIIPMLIAAVIDNGIESGNISNVYFYGLCMIMTAVLGLASSIDTHTEELVQNGMDKLMAGRTTFVIAHRLSTIRNADCIMVLENGRIIERGNHEQLIEEKGRYYELYTGNAISG